MIGDLWLVLGERWFAKLKTTVLKEPVEPPILSEKAKHMFSIYFFILPFPQYPQSSPTTKPLSKFYFVTEEFTKEQNKSYSVSMYCFNYAMNWFLCRTETFILSHNLSSLDNNQYWLLIA